MAGENENGIGTARAYLDIDASDWDTAIARAKNSAAGLGNAAEQAFDKSTKAQRRAANQLLTYVTGLDKTQEQQRVLIALMKGVPADIATAAAAAIEKQKAATAAAADEQRKLNALMDEAANINSQRDAQYASNTQSHINSLLGVNDGGSNAGRRADAEAAFVQLLDEEARAWQLAITANEEYDRQVQTSAQKQINALLGVQDAQQNSVRRNDAEIAFTQLLDEEARAWQEAGVINEEYNRQVTANAQQQINALLGIETAAERARSATNNRALAGRFELGPTSGEAAANAAFVQSLQRQYDYAGKTHFEILRLQAAEKGLTATAGPLIDKLEAQARAMRSGTLTTKQYEFALRGLPAQFTDIFTSLAAGQNPLMVLLQQGGQIKDMFGGIGGAARVVGAQVLKYLTNPFVLAAAAIAGWGYATFQGQKELLALEKATIASGDALGNNAQQLDAAAVAAGEATGKWGDARKAIEGLSKAGFGGAGVGGLSIGVVDAAKVTGESIDEIIADFKSLETKPSESVAKLNAQYNFLTAAQFAQIQSLQEVGRTRDAARIAEQAYTNAMKQRAAEVDANAGWLIRSAHAVRDAWGETWNAVKDAGKPETLAEQAKKLEDQIKRIRAATHDRDGNVATDEMRKKALAKPLADLAAIRKQQWDEALAASQQQDEAAKNRQSIAAQQALAQFASPDKKLENALAIANQNRYRALVGVVDPAKRAEINAQADEQIRQAQETYKSAMKKRNGSDSASDDVAAIKADAAAQKAAIAAQTQFVQGQFQLRQITMEDYYAKLKELAQQSGDVEVASINKQIAAEKAHGATKEKIQQLEAQLLTARQNTATKEAELNNQEALAIQRRTDAIAAYKERLDAQTLSLQRNLDAMVNRVGMGQHEFEIAQRINEVYNEQADALARIDQEYAKSNDKVKRDAERNAVLGETADRIDAITNAYKRLDAKQLDVTNGMKAAFDDFAYSSLQLSDNFQSVWTTALGSIGNQAARTATGVGQSFEDMAKDIAATAIRVLTNSAVTQFVKIIQQYLGSGASTGSSFTGTTTSSGALAGPYAKGGAFEGSPSLSAYSNSIVSSPTYFKFAKGGALGVAGEMKAEAIMPLSRDSSGVLGVRSYGGGTGAPVVNVNITGASSKPSVSSRPNGNGGVDIDVLFDQFDKATAAGISSGTSATSVAIQKRFPTR